MNPSDISASVRVLDGEIVVSWPQSDYHKPKSPQRAAVEALSWEARAAYRAPRFTIRKGRFQFHFRKAVREYTDRDGEDQVTVDSEFYIDPEFSPALGETRLVL